MDEQSHQLTGCALTHSTDYKAGPWSKVGYTPKWLVWCRKLINMMLNRGKEGWRGFSLEQWHADMLRNPAALAVDAIQYTLHHGTDVRLRGRFKPYRCRWHPAGGLRNQPGGVQHVTYLQFSMPLHIKQRDIILYRRECWDRMCWSENMVFQSDSSCLLFGVQSFSMFN